MAIDIAWATTKRIFVPRADMTIVQASPEIRELDVDAFRLSLKNLEASVEGMPWPDTHRHTTESVLSGTTFARQVVVLAPYLVEFEDGQYGVRTAGGNHNLLDVKVNNQVSLLGILSAGLIVSPASVIAPTQQQIRDALKIAPSAGAPDAESIDAKLNALPTSTVRFNVAYDVASTTLDLRSFLERSGDPVSAPLSIAVTWYDTDGSVLFSLAETDALPGEDPDPNGNYHFTKVQALQSNETYLVDTTITDAVGAVIRRENVTTVSA
jgi:hypothetical protein